MLLDIQGDIGACLYTDVILKLWYYFSDINECQEESHECDDICVDETINEYDCGCSDHYSIAPDGKSCIGEFT